MAKLKFEINTDDMFQDYDEEFGYSGKSFEALFKEGLSKEIKDKVTSDISKEQIKEITKTIKEGVIESVEKKLSNLINEEVAFTNGWGEPKFVGSVEDYIKKQIDEKLLSPADTDGKKLSGCRLDSGNITWIEWSVKKEIKSYLSTIKQNANDFARNFCKKELKEALEEFKIKTLKGLVVDHLESVGVINK